MRAAVRAVGYDSDSLNEVVQEMDTVDERWMAFIRHYITNFPATEQEQNTFWREFLDNKDALVKARRRAMQVANDLREIHDNALDILERNNIEGLRADPVADVRRILEILEESK